MNNLLNVRRDYQADIYFALATIIQAIILTALGTELVVLIKAPIVEDMPWIIITGLQSLIICVSFWYHFVRDYFFGFRMIELNAINHLILAFTFFLIGLLQFMAFQFLDEPRIWYLLILVSIGCVFINSWYMTKFVKMEDNPIEKNEAEGVEISKLTGVSYIAALICMVVWFIVPEITTPLFKGMAFVITTLMLGFFIVEALQSFQMQIDREK